jgi:phosphoribosyl 1,2-cyclic phosphate phosphodiesterase
LSALTVTILGCGGSAGMPQIGGPDGSGDWGEVDPAEPKNRRTRPSILITAPDGQNLLVDTGPDLRLQLTSNKIKRVDAIFYTHAHADHIAGLDEIRILNRLLDAPMPTYADKSTLEELEKRFDYAFRPWTEGTFFFRPVLDTHVVVPPQRVDVGGLPLHVFTQDHGFITTLGLRTGGFAYCTDVKRLDDAALDTLAGLDTLVVDCFTRGAPHPTHANLAEVQDWVERLRPARTILTHLGPSMDYGWGLAHLPAGIEMGFDGMRLEIG